MALSVSQWNSSSDSRPSGWLWQLVSGASMKRFFSGLPCFNGSGSNRLISAKAWSPVFVRT